MFRFALLLVFACSPAFVGFSSPAQDANNRPKDANGDPLPPGAVARLGTTRLWHPGTIGALAFSPDGKILASGGLHGHPVYQPHGGCAITDSSTLLLWDAVHGTVLRELQAPFEGIRYLAFSPDGKQLAAGFEKALCVWEVSTGKESWQVKDLGELKFVSFSRDGKSIAVGDSQTVSFWSWPEGKKQKKFSAPSPPKNSAERIWKHLSSGLSPDGRRIAWSYFATKPAKPGVAYSLNPLECHFIIWDTAEDRQVWQFSDGPTRGSRGFGNPVFSPSGNLVVGLTDLWDIDGRTKHCPLPDDQLMTLVFSPKGEHLLGSSGNWLYLLDVNSGRVLREVNDVPSLWRVPYLVGIHHRPMAFSPDGSTLAVGHSPIQLLSITPGKPESPFARFRDVVSFLETSLDGQTLFTGGPASGLIPSPQSLFRWQDWWTTAAAPAAVFRKRTDWPLALSLKHNLLISGDESTRKETLSLKHLTTGKTLRNLQTKDSLSNGIFTPGGQSVLLNGEKKYGSSE